MEVQTKKKLIFLFLSLIVHYQISASKIQDTHLKEFYKKTGGIQ